MTKEQILDLIYSQLDVHNTQTAIDIYNTLKTAGILKEPQVKNDLLPHPVKSIEQQSPEPSEDEVIEDYAKTNHSIWVCESCHYEFEGPITGKHWPYPNKDPETGYSCDGIVREYVSKEKLKDGKPFNLNEWRAEIHSINDEIKRLRAENESLQSQLQVALEALNQIVGDHRDPPAIYLAKEALRKIRGEK